MNEINSTLLTDIENLQALVHSQRIQIETLKEEKESMSVKYQQLLEQFKLALTNRYLPKTEKLTSSHQYGLFDEAGSTEGIHEAQRLTDEKIIISYERKNKPIRKPLPKDIPRETIVHDINEQEKYCSCGLLLEQIGEEVSEQLDIIPLQLKAIEHVRPKYACRKCQGNIKISNMPKLFLPKSIATAGLAAYIITTKYEDHIPLYRQEKMFKRYGIDLPRSTSCGIVLASSQLCEPLLNCFQENIIRYDYCQVDETPVQVLKTPNRKNTDKSYMWCYKGGPPDSPSIIFDYQETRGGYHAKHFLADFKGHIQCDGYSGYNWIEDFNEISRGGCLLHARRKFMDVIKISQSDGLAQQGLNYFQKLYTIEDKARKENMSTTERYELRLNYAKPILIDFKDWLDNHINGISVKQKIGEAINYTLNQWSLLISYLNDGRYEIDNNNVENLIRPFALGRRNWLFMGSPRGARAGAILYSLIATAKANGLIAYEYLRYVFEHIRDCRESKDYWQLMPQNLRNKEPFLIK